MQAFGKAVLAGAGARRVGSAALGHPAEAVVRIVLLLLLLQLQC